MSYDRGSEKLHRNPEKAVHPSRRVQHAPHHRDAIRRTGYPADGTGRRADGAESEFQTASGRAVDRTDHHDGSGRRGYRSTRAAGAVRPGERRGRVRGASRKAADGRRNRRSASGSRVRAEPDPACHARGSHRGPRRDAYAWGEPDRTGGDGSAGFRDRGRGVPGYRPADRPNGAGGVPSFKNPSHRGRTHTRIPRTWRTRPGRSTRRCCRPSGYRPDLCIAGRMPCSSDRWTLRFVPR